MLRHAGARVARSEAGITLARMDGAQAPLELTARVKFGRGMGHGGVVNYDGAFSYALARTHNAPLLFLGNDFPTADIKSALTLEDAL